jgi:hypothetical protein
MELLLTNKGVQYLVRPETGSAVTSCTGTLAAERAPGAGGAPTHII